MDQQKQDSSLLYQTLKWLHRERGFHICIHDTSGLLHSQPELHLPLEYTIHKSYFCDCAKTTNTGLRACLRCKHHSISKALKEKEAYTGQCYLGVAEIVKPVFYHDRMICIIYVGNFQLEFFRPQMGKKIEKICGITGVKQELLLEAQSSLKPVSLEQLKEYEEVTKIVCHIILSTLRENPHFKGRASSTSPIYTGATHWVIESVQNYVASYYNRDLKLSQLAALHFLNPQYLCRLFKAETGTNFSDYVNKYRIQSAQKLLRTTKDEILEISLQVGFNNVTYFNRLFKKYTGVTPGEYRLNAGEERENGLD